ncbi:MAG TPA: ABC transporter ATP-binding protein [Kofleriaceae bacterium]|nr:ABC transporter ATP-binding protein [Kofleriaceae bacterium]
MAEWAIEAVNLTRRFGAFTAVNAINLQVAQGEIFGFLGANGAGKTTAMRIFCGLLEPTSGQATVAGFDAMTQSEKIKQQIGYMSQKFSLYGKLTVRQNIRFFAGIYGLSRAQVKSKTAEIVERLGLADAADKLVDDLPLGWKQRISFAVATVHQPKVVFLDEPTGGVDPMVRRQFWDMIFEAAAQGMTVFVTTHYMDEAEYCDRVSIMVDGSIAAIGTPAELYAQHNASSVEEVFVALARKATRHGD